MSLMDTRFLVWKSERTNHFENLGEDTLLFKYILNIEHVRARTGPVTVQLQALVNTVRTTGHKFDEQFRGILTNNSFLKLTVEQTDEGVSLMPYTGNSLVPISTGTWAAVYENNWTSKT